MCKAFNSEVVTVGNVARKMGAVATKSAICPGCGTVETMDILVYELEAVEGKIKDKPNPKADGIKWCSNCDGV